MSDSQTTPARELFRVATEQGWAAFEAACRKTLADEWRLGFDAGTRVASRVLKP